jgi:hypothetical protein
MSDSPISLLGPASSLNLTDLMEVSQSVGGGAYVSAKGTLAQLKTLFGIGGKVAANIGDGSAATFTLTHNLGTRDVSVTVYRNATPWDDVICDVARPDANNVTISGFGSAPSSNQFRVVIRS